MEFPELITRLPLADLPFPGVDGHLLRSADGLVVFFHFRVETTVPPMLTARNGARSLTGRWS